MTGTFAPQTPALTLEIAAIKKLSDADQFPTRAAPRGPAQRDGELYRDLRPGETGSRRIA
jgi:hypothetical protein